MVEKVEVDIFFIVLYIFAFIPVFIIIYCCGKIGFMWCTDRKRDGQWPFNSATRSAYQSVP